MSSATDLKEHLGDCVKFLVDYEWIFSSANTRFINDNTFLHADPLWIQLFAGRISTAEYSKIPGGYINVRFIQYYFLQFYIALFYFRNVGQLVLKHSSVN